MRIWWLDYWQSSIGRRCDRSWLGGAAGDEHRSSRAGGMASAALRCSNRGVQSEPILPTRMAMCLEGDAVRSIAYRNVQVLDE
jgi:hypothetical protein